MSSGSLDTLAGAVSDSQRALSLALVCLHDCPTMEGQTEWCAGGDGCVARG